MAGFISRRRGLLGETGNGEDIIEELSDTGRVDSKASEEILTMLVHLCISIQKNQLNFLELGTEKTSSVKNNNIFRLEVSSFHLRGINNENSYLFGYNESTLSAKFYNS